MSKTVAILQSGYAPWKGYFDLISRSDYFVFHDDLQYTKNDWRNRNLIKWGNETKWLTIPCGREEKRLICDVVLQDPSWQRKHWSLLYQAYRKSPYFNLYRPFLEDFYLSKKWGNLSELCQYMIKWIAREVLNLETIFLDSRNYQLKTRKAERVLELLKKLEATDYVSGPAARDYLSEDIFDENNIRLHWMRYQYPEYPQFGDTFIHKVSILDLIFHVGPRAIKFIRQDHN